MLILLSSLSLAVPLQMTQQGRVVDSAGVPYEGAYIFQFHIYDAQSGGNALWSEVQTVNVLNGYYSAVLGADVQNNPLNEQVLSLYPLYLELQVAANAPLDRQAIHSAPYAQMSGVAESVDGGSVNASDISVGGAPVVDSGRNWVGEPLTVDWSNVTGIPNGFSDGVDDVLNESQVEGFITNGGVDLSSNTTLGGQSIVTTDNDQDSLALFSCTDGQILKFDSAIGDWFCESDSDSLNALSCSGGQVAVYDQALAAWVCGESSDTLAALSCSVGEVAYNDGQAWVCQQVEELFDKDQDGLFIWEDCDDNDSNSYSQAQDIDCDGYLTDVDCDNADPNSYTINEDADCDGIPTADDCDDNDSNSTSILNDLDCDGSIGLLDCDDNDPTRSPAFSEICGDGIDNDCDGFDETCFEAVTFTTCGSAGQNGPDQSSCNLEYFGTGLDGLVTVNAGYQYFEIPQTGSYTIEVYGAQGGDGGGYTGGAGAYMKADFEFIQGETIVVLVGQRGGSTGSNCAAGGGGTFVALGNAYSTSQPLIIAGGGGGASAYSSYHGYPGVEGESGTVGADGCCAGTSGNGGTGDQGGNGAGFYGNAGASNYTNDVALSFVNGGVGGYYSSSHPLGGFGGGGASHENCEPGAGGGYSGGSGDWSGPRTSGGGGSYNSGTNLSSGSGIHSGHGQVVLSPSN